MKRQHLIQVSLLGLGVIAWGSAGVALEQKGAFLYEPNVLTLKRSPFGRTVAIAMRGPADVYWNQGEAHAHSSDHKCSGGGCSHQDCPSPGLLAGDAGEKDVYENPSMDDLLKGVRGNVEQEVTVPSEKTLLSGILDRIDGWKAAYYSRTNPFGSSKVHKTYLMGETEKRLRLSYEMDPSNFAAYGSYFLFRSEALSQLKEEGESEEIQRRAIDAALGLSGYTLRYCLERSDEPGALLTAAAAAHDYLQVSYQRDRSTAGAEFYQLLQLQGQCLRDYAELKARMVTDGTWEQFPLMRQQEMEMHEFLLRKLHEGNVQMVRRESTGEEEQNNTAENLQSS